MEAGRKFLSDTIFYGLSLVLVNLAPLVTLPILTKSLTVEQYGVWAQVSVLISFLVSLVTLGSQMTVVRFGSGKGKKIASSLLHAALIVTLINCILAIIVLTLFQKEISFIFFGTSTYSELVPLIGVYLTTESAYGIIYSLLRSQHYVKSFSTCDLVRMFLQLSLIIVVLIRFNGDIKLLLTGYIAISILVSASIYLLIVVRNIGIHLDLAYFKGEAASILAFTLPVVLDLAATWVLNLGDRYLVIHQISISDNAVYAVACNLSNVLLFLYMPLVFIAYPLMVTYWDNNQKLDVQRMFERIKKTFLYFVIPAIFGFTLIGPRLILLLTTSNYNVSTALIIIILVGFLFNALYMINSYVIILAKKMYMNLLMMIAADVIKILCCIILIDQIGIYGAALSSLITYLFLFISMTYLVKKEIDYKIDIGFVFKCSLSALIMYLAISLINTADLPSIFIVIVIAAGIYIMLTLVLKVFSAADLEDIRSILSIKNKPIAADVK